MAALVAACQPAKLSDQMFDKRIIATGSFESKSVEQVADVHGQLRSVNRFTFRVEGRPRGYLTKAYEREFFERGSRTIQFLGPTNASSLSDAGAGSEGCPASISNEEKYLVFLRPIEATMVADSERLYEMSSCVIVDQNNSNGLVSDFED